MLCIYDALLVVILGGANVPMIVFVSYLLFVVLVQRVPYQGRESLKHKLLTRIRIDLQKCCKDVYLKTLSSFLTKEPELVENVSARTALKNDSEGLAAVMPLHAMVFSRFFCIII